MQHCSSYTRSAKGGGRVLSYPRGSGRNVMVSFMFRSDYFCLNATHSDTEQIVVESEKYLRICVCERESRRGFSSFTVLLCLQTPPPRCVCARVAVFTQCPGAQCKSTSGVWFRLSTSIWARMWCRCGRSGTWLLPTAQLAETLYPDLEFYLIEGQHSGNLVAQGFEPVTF